MPNRLTHDQPATYQIQVQGAVASHWADYLGGLDINVSRAQDPPVTILSGSIIDQAALLGVLNHLYDMGFPLLAVECRPVEDLAQAQMRDE